MSQHFACWYYRLAWDRLLRRDGDSILSRITNHFGRRNQLAIFAIRNVAFGLISLRHKPACLLVVRPTRQHGQRGSCSTRATISLRRSVVIEF
jgi:hypothetical protein